MSRFSGKTALVTGAGSGMGRVVAESLAGEGATVIALDVSLPTPFEVASITYRKHDVTNPSDWDALAADLTKDNGVDVLVNAAGIIDYPAIADIDLNSWRRTLSVDLDGVMLGMRAMIPLMQKAGKGSIVNFGSVWGQVAVPGIAAYQAAKGAMTALTRNAAITYATTGIRVNAIHPGIIATPMVLNQDPAINEACVAKTPMGRMGKPEEIARCVLFMASDECQFMTGADIIVDGGWTAQ